MEFVVLCHWFVGRKGNSLGLWVSTGALFPEIRELFRWLLKKRKRMPRETQTVEVMVMRFQRRTRTLLEMWLPNTGIAFW